MHSTHIISIRHQLRRSHNNKFDIMLGILHSRTGRKKIIYCALFVHSCLWNSEKSVLSELIDGVRTINACHVSCRFLPFSFNFAREGTIFFAKDWWKEYINPKVNEWNLYIFVRTDLQKMIAFVRTLRKKIECELACFSANFVEN